MARWRPTPGTVAAERQERTQERVRAILDEARGRIADAHARAAAREAELESRDVEVPQ
jgi:hypothetical protein